ncbi:transporter [Leifsonia xyli]|uniref:transporter n=1 Tax=Leifsonia xyli TaxID=1575 RepID=UPI003D678618
MVPSLRETSEQDAQPVASRSRPSRVPIGEMSTRRRTTRALWPPLTAFALGCGLAVLLLAGALRTEFPLFSEASAERGRDCTAIASARHALDATLQARLPLRKPDAETARAVRSAVAAFDARTQDIATPAVDAALGPVRGELSSLADTVQLSATAPAAMGSGAVDDALARVSESWKGAVARVCS